MYSCLVLALRRDEHLRLHKLFWGPAELLHRRIWGAILFGIMN